MKTYGGNVIPITRGKHTDMTTGADYLLRSAAYIDRFSQSRHLLISDGSPMAANAAILVKFGYIAREADGLSGTWYRLTAKGLAYQAAPLDPDRCMDCSRGRCCGNCGCCPRTG